jgi:hypothetical protein
MKTTLSDGTWIVYQRNNENEFAQVTNNSQCILVGLFPPASEWVQKVVWKKGEVIEARGQPRRACEIKGWKND